MTYERTPQEQIDEALRRYSVLDLREMTNSDLDAGELKALAADETPTVTEQGETDLIRWWKIRSGGNAYEVRRFENFVFCSCLDFFFSKTVCKHIAVTTTPYCSRCRSREATELGGLCVKCGIGGELEPGDSFRLDASGYNKLTVLTVAAVDADGVRVIDSTQPDTFMSLKPFQIDYYREQGKFQLLPPNFKQR